MNCPHFGVCGGCTVEGSAPPSYDIQLQRKEAQVHELLKDFVVRQWRPIVPSPQAWQYRNKMEFAFGWDGPGDMVVGLRQAGRYDRVVDLETCQLVSPEIAEILNRTRVWAQQNKLRGYHRKRHEGDLRYLVLREGKKTGQRLAFLLSRADVPHLEAWKEAIQPLASTAWHGVSDAKSDVARADDMRLLWGPGHIEEDLNGVRYQISPLSFFQTNTLATEVLYGLLHDWGRSIGGSLLDLYCGSGGITLALARSFDRVIGVDTNRDAIEDAKANAARNGLANVEFVCEDALDFLKKLTASKFAVQLSALIVDPPRAGLHPKTLASLVEMNPPQLAYISCNPESLARDIQSLAPLYEITSAQPVDLFPNTPHVETICLMEHR